MNANKNKLFAIYTPLLILFTIAVASFRTAALILDFDPTSGYFNSKTLITTANISAVSGVMLLFTYAPIRGSADKLRASFSTASTYLPTGIVAVALAFFSMDCFMKYKSLGRSFKELFAARNIPGMLLPILGILSLLAIGYFILNALVESRASEPRAALGICTVLLFALYASYLYFDSKLPLNAPNKIIDQMSYLFSALFFLYEIRISLGREKWNLYTAFGFIAVLLTGASSLPSIVLYFAEGMTVSDNIGETALTFCIFLFILSRIMLVADLRADTPSDFVDMMRAASNEREAYVSERRVKIESATSELIAAMLEETAAKVEESEKNNEGIPEEDLIEILESSEDITEDESKDGNGETKKAAEDHREIADENASDDMTEDESGVSWEDPEQPKKDADTLSDSEGRSDSEGDTDTVEEDSDTVEEDSEGDTDTAKEDSEDVNDVLLTKASEEFVTDGAILKYTGKEATEEDAAKEDVTEEDAAKKDVTEEDDDSENSPKEKPEE